MKTILHVLTFTFTIICIVMVSETVSANWVKNEDPDIQTAYETISGSGMKDSLPDGISKDWLNNLTDENGKKIIPEKDNRNNSRQIPEDPEGDAIQRKVFNGLSVNSSFGMSVSSAGDVNGDGYDDIIVSAPEYSSGTGRAYIFYGGQFMNTIADVTLTGETTFNYFGRSVSSAGDVNG
ncbi:MAG: FG-GAP repeat protein, partial [Ignavibacteriae bacterium]|nr:FG-GAP repeat protein [Ignavibacteriota bacterium]